MKRLYEKSEIWFAVLCIITYVIVAGNFRNNFGDDSVFTLMALLIMAALITVFIYRNNLSEKMGLIYVKGGRRYLWYIPLIIVCSINLWFGVQMHYEPMHQVIAVLGMGLVGYIEEVIFRGFLFRAIERENVTRALIISAVTFGAGHIVNILTGQADIETFLQMGYATAIGFAFVYLFYRSKSLIPCIVAHSLIDITSQFSNQNLTKDLENIWNYAGTAVILVVAGGYAIYLAKLKNN